jgi:GNAT superfamily N-acetyltransferase
MINIQIRDGGVGDAAGVARVRIETWRSAYRDLMPAAVLAGMDLEKDILRQQEYLAHPVPERHLFVAEKISEETRPEVIGFCGVGVNREPDPAYSGELYAIYVLPDFQGQGVGKRLVQAARGWMRTQGHPGFLLWVLRDNLPARRFYEALGGQAVREHIFSIGGADLPEIGYGFRIY